MKLVINEKHIKRNKNIGSIIFIINLLVLGTGAYFAFSGDMTKVYYSWMAVIIGFTLTRVSMYFMNRYARSPRLDEILAEEFGKLRHDYTFFSFSSPVPYLLLGPCRIWLPIIVNSGGEISFKNGKWRHTGVGIFQRITGQESVVIPELEVAEASKKIQEQLAKNGIPYEEQPPLEPIIILFMTNTTVGDLEDAPYAVVKLPELKRYIRKQDRQDCTNAISPEENDKLIKALAKKK